MTDTIELSIKAKAPNFSLPANTGAVVTLADYHTKNNVYLFFLREFV